MPETKKNFLKQLDETLTDLFVKKLPPLPANFKELLVTFAPWGSIIMILLSVPLILSVLGLGAMFSPFLTYYRFNFYIGLAFSLFAIILQGMAVKPLMDRKMQGWNYLFYSFLVSVVANLFSLRVGNIIGMLISLYFLYQVKSEYK